MEIVLNRVTEARFAGLFLLFALSGCAVAQEETAVCPPETGAALQVLGSGGPIADDGRASSSYIVWVDGRSRVLIDAGGGAFLRFGEASAKFEDLDFIGLSHFHTDHSADFPALLKSGNFSDGENDLYVAGPDGRGPFPSLNDYLEELLGAGGAYAYLGGYLDGTDGLRRIRPATVLARTSQPIFQAESGSGPIRVFAMPVPHGIVPSVAFRVEVGERSVVFSSDQNGSDDNFIDFAGGADLLIAHFAIPEVAGRIARRLHAQPSTWGEMAARSDTKHLLLSHFMRRSLRQLEANVGEVERQFDGRVSLAEDLLCVPLSTEPP
ncbi:MAG: MBL fold metallo-hydrolase [Pseudomonadota bacterium]